MSDRLTRKEMKRKDSFQLTMVRLLDLVQLYRRHLIWGMVALVVLVLAAVGWVVYRHAQENDAQQVLADAIEAYGAPIKGDSDTSTSQGSDDLSFPSEEARQARAKELFETVRDDYGSTEAGDLAAVYLGEIAAHEGDTKRARELWEAFLDDHPDHLLTNEVRLNLFALDRAEGKGEELVSELQEMLGHESRPLPEDVILYELATTLESLGRKEEADQQYERLVTEFTQSPYAQLARQKTGGGGQQGIPGLPS